jgi:hypothetical protein
MVPHDGRMPLTSQWGHGGEAPCQCSTGLVSVMLRWLTGAVSDDE